MIRANDISMQIEGKRVFSGVSVECKPGTIAALTGASGCGKTTLLNCLSVLLRPSSGVIEIDGVSTEKWGERQRLQFWREKAAFIYQDYGIIEEENVDFNIRFKSAPLFRKSPRPDAYLMEVLETVGLSDRLRSRAAVLSGGEKQRVGIARAMYKKAAYVFADEPTASLDEANRRRVTELLRASAARGACIILATHDEELAQLADERYVLDSF